MSDDFSMTCQWREAGSDFTILRKNVKSFLSGFLINQILDLMVEGGLKTSALIYETMFFFLHMADSGSPFSGG